MKRISLILCLILVVTINCFSATRQEIQVALDLIKYVNVMNDLSDSIVPILRGNKTVTEKKEFIVLMGTNIKNYRTRVDKFLSKPENRISASNGLIAWGVDKEELKADVLLIDTTIDTIKSNIANTKTQEDMNTLADTIETTIPKLPLVRKAE